MNYGLTEAQVRFAAHFAEHGKQQDAYIFAYGASVKPAIASERGRRLLRNAVVRDRIEKLRGGSLPPGDTVVAPQSRSAAAATGADANREAADAVKALAVVAASPAIPHDHRIASIELLQDMLANIRATLADLPPQQGVGGRVGIVWLRERRQHGRQQCCAREFHLHRWAALTRALGARQAMAAKSNRKAKVGTKRATATVTRLPTNSRTVGSQRTARPTLISPPVAPIAVASRQADDVGAAETILIAPCDQSRLLDLPASAVAAGFLAWIREHGLSRREWTVDDLWYIVEEDFAVALGFALPPRRVFLGALQKLAGVQVQYDRRIYDRQGKLLRKTTFYRFVPMAEAAPGNSTDDLPLFAVAA